MSYDQKDRVIVGQNAATAAAAIVAAEINSGNGPFRPERFEEIRQTIAAGSLNFGSGTASGVAAVVSAFPGAQVDQQPAQTYQAPAPQSPSGGTAPNHDFVVNSGKHKGLTLAQIDATDRSWLEWADVKLQNDYARSRISEYVRATAA